MRVKLDPISRNNKKKMREMSNAWRTQKLSIYKFVTTATVSDGIFRRNCRAKSRTRHSEIITTIATTTTTPNTHGVCFGTHAASHMF